MLGILKWLSTQPTPQEEFHKRFANAGAPPTYPFSSPSRSSAATAAPHHLPPESFVVDPYHLVICQHGVLSTSADFDNVIADLFVHHEVTVLEAAELAAKTSSLPKTETARQTHSSVFSRSTASPNGGGAMRHVLQSMSNTRAPETPTVSEAVPCDGTARPFTYGTSIGSYDNDDMNGSEEAASAPLQPDTALTPEQRQRRETYKKTFHLNAEYPNRTHGRLYRSGNLQCFSPGSNNYLHSDAGTLACARKMLAETVPVIHSWLDGVEAREQQRRAKWAVYARTFQNTADVARLAAEGATPLPVCLSFMAHSFGGIIERECLYLLLADDTEMKAANPLLFDSILQLRHRLCALNVTFENFLTIATPHCGTGECLWWPIYFGAWCLARLKLCQTYDELIISDAERILQTRLIDDPHLRVLELFRRRVLFANTHRDILVGFGTCSLIFENVNTDHTRLIPSAANAGHCAAAFADDTTEISKPILLTPFERVQGNRHGSFGSPKSAAGAAAAAAVAAVASAVSSAASLSAPPPAVTVVRSNTLHDLSALLGTPCSAPASSSCFAYPHGYAESRGVSRATFGEASKGEEDDEETELECRDAMSETLRPQATFSSSLAGLVASPLSPHDGVAGPVSVSADVHACSSNSNAVVTVGRTVPFRAMEEVFLEEIVPVACGAADDEEGEPQEGMLNQDPETQNRVVVTTQIAVTSPSKSASHFRGMSDSDSMSSGRSRSSRVVSVLSDPRWTSEHVRRAASTMQAEVTKRLRTVAVLAKQKGGKEGTATATVTTTTTTAPTEEGAPAQGAADVSTKTLSTVHTTTAESNGFSESTSLSTMSSCASYLIPSPDIPQYRQTPRAIAARLREKLSWRVRAVRFDNLIPVGHVACLGNWAFCGRSPLLVQAVAEELLLIL